MGGADLRTGQKAHLGEGMAQTRTANRDQAGCSCRVGRVPPAWPERWFVWAHAETKQARRVVSVMGTTLRTRILKDRSDILVGGQSSLWGLPPGCWGLTQSSWAVPGFSWEPGAPDMKSAAHNLNPVPRAQPVSPTEEPLKPAAGGRGRLPRCSPLGTRAPQPAALWTTECPSPVRVLSAWLAWPWPPAISVLGNE